MSVFSSLTFALPVGWSYPSFAIGNTVPDGMIIGMEYFPEGSAFVPGWHYSILPNLEAKCVIYKTEAQLYESTNSASQ